MSTVSGYCNGLCLLRLHRPIQQHTFDALRQMYRAKPIKEMAHQDSVPGEVGERKAIEKVDITLPRPNDSKKLAFVLYNVYTEEECKKLIRDTEKRGYIPAVVNTMGGEVYDPDYRKSSRCLVDSFEYADDLWSRVKEFIPEVFQERKVIRINERFRFLRYDAGDFFRPHKDGCYQAPNGDRTLLTIQLYLNEDFVGGETTFLEKLSRDVNGKDAPVKPRTGMVLVFQHDIYHEGSELMSGRKYAVRSDILYSAERVSHNK